MQILQRLTFTEDSGNRKLPQHAILVSDGTKSEQWISMTKSASLRIVPSNKIRIKISGSVPMLSPCISSLYFLDDIETQLLKQSLPSLLVSLYMVMFSITTGCLWSHIAPSMLFQPLSTMLIVLCLRDHCLLRLLSGTPLSHTSPSL